VLLKLSGEAFGKEGRGIAHEALSYVVEELRAARRLGVELAVVVGGGNFVRGSSLGFLDRAVADRMGMLATLINGLALAEALHKGRVPTTLQSAIATIWTDPLDPHRAREALSEGKIVIFTGGTGNPFVTTDTAAAIRAAEIGAEVLLKATRVEGVYTADPKRDPQAKLLKNLSYERAIRERLGVMDLSALTLCQEHRIPIVVFDFFEQGNLKRLLRGEEVGTRVRS